MTFTIDVFLSITEGKCEYKMDCVSKASEWTGMLCETTPQRHMGKTTIKVQWR